MKQIVLILFMLFVQYFAKANNDLPIDTLGSSDASKPLVFYISGDGGFNSFSTSFIKQWNSLGYPVVALDARSYFFTSQQPDAAAKDITSLLFQYMNLWKRKDVILVGYSFGADVLPFIQTRLPAVLTGKVKHTILLSPSHSTDFAVHLFYAKSGSNVPAEINKLTRPTLIVFGEDEKDIADKEINNPQATVFKISGGHHYDKQVSNLVGELVKKL